MNNITVRLTVFFEDPFWIGIFERISGERVAVCKVTFGSEPKDYEVYDYILRNYYRLRFSPSVSTQNRKSAVNPKRMQREVKKQLTVTGIGTKSQQALSLQHEEMKTERKKLNREQKEAEKERMFEIKQQQRKERHRGR